MSKSGLYAHFRSKEALQLAVLGSARERFVDQVIRPALAAPRGEPRVRTLFERWLWRRRPAAPAACSSRRPRSSTTSRDPSVTRSSATTGTSSSPSPRCTARASRRGAFREDLAPEQFAHDLHGLMLAHFHAFRLLQDPAAETRTRFAFERLMQSLQPDD